VTNAFRSLPVLRKAWWIGMLLLTVGVQLEGLYAPQAPGPALFDGADKVAHAVLFGTPLLVCLFAGLAPRVALVALLVHAPVSELIQHIALPGRSGDPWDVVADVTGILLAWTVGSALVARVRGRARAEEPG
jgi:hypothetical protein